MIIAWNDGHTVRGVGGGAVGIKSETGLNRPLGAVVREKLKALGHTVILCNVDEGVNSLAEICRLANKQHVDIFVSNHFNAGGGQGVEVLVYDNKSTKAIEMGNRICKEISALGFKNRGVKYRPDLYVLNSTKSQALLIENCFVDSASDMALYNQEKFADAIVYAITGQAPVKKPSKAYIVTDYISQGECGVEDSTLRRLYFDGVEKLYYRSNPTGIWVETQYLELNTANAVAEKLKRDKLFYRMVTV